MKQGDKLIIVFLVIVCIFVLFNGYASSYMNALEVVVNVDGKKMYTIPLDSDGIFHVESKEGHVDIEVLDRRVHVKDSTCKDKLCILQGWIERTGESIICLPNRITLTIDGGSNELDGTTY